MIKVLTVSYNTPDLISDMIKSFRQFYDNEILLVDGSDAINYEQTKELLKDIQNIEIHHFNFNIHHGPALEYGFKTIDSNQILVIDSDVKILNKGCIEDLEYNLPEWAYGIGDCQFVDDKGFNVGSRGGAIGLKESEMITGGYRYLHPAFMLINREVALNWPMPIKHGAPMIETMKAINKSGRQKILIHSDWVNNDFRNPDKKYIVHYWMGTVSKTGGYNLT